MLTALTIFSTGHFLVGGIALSGVRSIRTASRPQTTAVVYTAMAQVGIIRVASRSCVLVATVATVAEKLYSIPAVLLQ